MHEYSEWLDFVNRTHVTGDGAENKRLNQILSRHRKLINSLVGAVVDYDQLPYEMGTPEYDRLSRTYIASTAPDGSNVDKGYLGYVLDLQAAVDFVSYHMETE